MVDLEKYSKIMGSFGITGGFIFFLTMYVTEQRSTDSAILEELKKQTHISSVLVTNQQNQEKRIDRHDIRLDNHDALLYGADNAIKKLGSRITVLEVKDR